MNARHKLVVAVGVALGIAACDRIVTVTGPTVYVDKPGRSDTVVAVRPETSFVQLPGRVDTVVTWDTLRIVTHDTVVVHDTVTHVDTLWREQVLSALCVVGLRADSAYVDTLARSCSVERVRLDYPTLPLVLGDTMRLRAGQTVRLAALPVYTVRWVGPSP